MTADRAFTDEAAATMSFRAWLRALLDPRMPGADATTLPFRPGIFALLTLVMVPLAIARYLLGVLDTSAAQGPTVLLGLAAALAILVGAFGVGRLRQVDAAAWRALGWNIALYLAFWYWGRVNAFEDVVLPALGQRRADVPLAAFAFFCLNNGIMMLLPSLLLERVVNGRAPGALGMWSTGPAVRPLWPLYAVAFLVVLPFVIHAGTMASFLDRYPLYEKVLDRDNSLSWSTLVVCELLYLAQFAFVEAFFRGAMLFSLERSFGAYALPLVLVPYVAGHFGKPMPEALGAILAGTALGWLALKHRSIWLGVALHVGVGWVMDAMALWGRGVRIGG